MWHVNVSYEDAGNFLTNRQLFTGAIQSVVSYLNAYVQGTGTIELLVSVSQTATGRFAGNGANAEGYVKDGLNYLLPEVAQELKSGTNLNGNTPDLTIYIDPGSDYFRTTYVDAAPYLSALTVVPGRMTDGQSVILHEILHGLGINSYADGTGSYSVPYRTAWDSYLKKSGTQLLLDMPSFANRGLAPIQITSDSDTQNIAHLANNGNLAEGYVDDVMNGLAFYYAHRYYLSQIDLMILEGLGYKVTIPESMPLSYFSMSGKGLTTPTIASGAGMTSSNLVHLSGTAAAGAMTSILEHGKLLGSVIANASGYWSLDVTTDPSLWASTLVVRDGTHAVDATALALVRDSSSDLHLYSSQLYNNLIGSNHNDLITATVRGASIDGGDGFDTVEYSAARSANTIVKQGNGFTVTDAQGTDNLVNVERIRFSDSMVAFDVGSDGVAGQAYRLYQAAFNRVPDQGGLGFWIGQMDHGLSLHQVAEYFLASPEFAALYGSHPNDAQLVTAMYANVLHRAPDEGGYAFWTGHLASGLSHADLLTAFSESLENQAALVGVVSNGVTFIVS